MRVFSTISILLLLLIFYVAMKEWSGIYHRPDVEIELLEKRQMIFKYGILIAFFGACSFWGLKKTVDLSSVRD